MRYLRHGSAAMARYVEMRSLGLDEVLGKVASAEKEDLDEAARRLFDSLRTMGNEGVSEVPLIKTLREAVGDELATYQFKHLSFQESLYAQDLVEYVRARRLIGWEGENEVQDI